MPSVPQRPHAQEGQRPAGHGASYAYIVRTLEGDNAQLDQRDRVTIDSIRNHTARHFAVQNVAQAAYRDILERRAKENAIDFVEGVATALTPMAYLEVVMAKAFRSWSMTVPASVSRPACGPPKSSSQSSTKVTRALISLR